MFRIIDKKWVIIFVWTLLMSTHSSTVFSEYQLTANQSVSYANESVIVNNSVKYTGPIYAIAMSVFLPENVSFISSNTNERPIISPKKGDTGTLEFVWLKPPESPFHMNYIVKSARSSGVIHSRITYRRLNAALHYDLPDVHLVQ